MNYLTAVHTDVGIRKKTNQDSALVMEATTDKGNVLLTVFVTVWAALLKVRSPVLPDRKSVV